MMIYSDLKPFNLGYNKKVNNNFKGMELYKIIIIIIIIILTPNANKLKKV